MSVKVGWTHGKGNECRRERLHSECRVEGEEVRWEDCLKRFGVSEIESKG